MAGIFLFFTFVVGLVSLTLFRICFESIIVAANICIGGVLILSCLKRGSAVSFNNLLRTGLFLPDNIPHIRSPT